MEKPDHELRRHLTIATAAAALLAGGFAVAPAAYAADGTAPACIGRVVDRMPDGQHVFLMNRCGKTMHVKVVVNGDFDSNCFTLGNGSDREYVITNPTGSYDKTVVC